MITSSPASPFRLWLCNRVSEYVVVSAGWHNLGNLALSTTIFHTWLLYSINISDFDQVSDLESIILSWNSWEFIFNSYTWHIICNWPALKTTRLKMLRYSHPSGLRRPVKKNQSPGPWGSDCCRKSAISHRYSWTCSARRDRSVFICRKTPGAVTHTAPV